MKTQKSPKCNVCAKRAERWDGGFPSWVSRKGFLEPAPPTWLCKKHDPHHKCFDLPKDKAHRAVIFVLRDMIQELFVRNWREKSRHHHRESQLKDVLLLTLDQTVGTVEARVLEVLKDPDV